MRIGFIYLGGDDPRKNTALKLERLGIAKRMSYHPGIRSLALHPYADSYLLNSDRNAAERLGIMALDCSWNKIGDLSRLKLRNMRRLPPLLAANPVNYGKVTVLSSAEALAAALFILGDPEGGESILVKFKWGPNFYVLNKNPLEEYLLAASNEEVDAIATQYF